MLKNNKVNFYSGPDDKISFGAFLPYLQILSTKVVLIKALNELKSLGLLNVMILKPFFLQQRNLIMVITTSQ